MKKCGFWPCHFAVGVPRCLVGTEPLREIIVHILSDARAGSSEFDKNACPRASYIAFDPDAPMDVWFFKLHQRSPEKMAQSWIPKFQPRHEIFGIQISSFIGSFCVDNAVQKITPLESLTNLSESNGCTRLQIQAACDYICKLSGVIFS